MQPAELLDDTLRSALGAQALAPLWELLRGAIPLGRPAARTTAHCWSYGELKPLLLEAARRVPLATAERRVLVLTDPGRGPAALQATGTIYAGIQILLPGECAPTHRHTPSAARIVIEGRGGFTTVRGRRCEMARGDVVLTPSGEWHDHGHDGSEPVTWLDVLDLPVFTAAEAACAENGDPEINREDPLVALSVKLRTAGLAPASGYVRRTAYPQLRFPWQATRTALLELLRAVGPSAAEVHYVNPETGDSCLPIMGITASLVGPGHVVRPPPRSCSALYHVVEGTGRSSVDTSRFVWGPGDTFSAPSCAAIEHEVATDREPAFLLRIDDEPLQRKLGLFSERLG
jgi:gentisate 1,2-dioxygenase